MSEIKISDEAKRVGLAEVEERKNPVGYHIQLLLNQRDAELAELKRQYNELITCVVRKFPNETRHQTEVKP